MRKIIFDDIDELVNNAKQLYSLHEETIGIICPYDYVAWVLETMVKHDIPISYIDFSDYEIDGYDKEYQISIVDGKIFCEPSYAFKSDGYRRDGYLHTSAKVMFVHSDCNSAILGYIESDTIYEFAFDGYDDDNDEKKNEPEADGTFKSDGVSITRSKDGKPEGFTRSWHISDDDNYKYMSVSYNSDDMDDLEKIAKIFGVTL